MKPAYPYSSTVAAKGKVRPSIAPQKKKFKPSKETIEKAELCKSYIQEKYQKLLEEEKKKKEYWDLLVSKMTEIEMSSVEQDFVKQDILHQEAKINREKRKKISPSDFNPIAIIGRGAFGEVRLCKWKDNGELVAIKKMRKSDMIKKNQIQHIRAERDVLANAQLPWIVELKCSFQDDSYLYLVMEYLPGGDLMSLLMKKDILTEEEGRFYMAQSVLAVDAVHKLNYIHRDLKPDNILIDVEGHIKLSDFGLCKYYEIQPNQFGLDNAKNEEIRSPRGEISHEQKKLNFKRDRSKVYSLVGTPDYIAPEVFEKNGYTETVDWWSLGAILFEMLVGYPPFFAETPSATCKRVMDWRKHFSIPKEANLSPEATNLLKRLMADPSERLGINGVEEIKAHPFFAGVSWKHIRKSIAPNIPQLKDMTDTSNFDNFDEDEPWIVPLDQNKRNKRNVDRANDVHFIGYTYKRDVETKKLETIANIFEEINSNRAAPKRQKTVDKIEVGRLAEDSDTVSKERPLKSKRGESDKNIKVSNHLASKMEKKKLLFSSSLLKANQPILDPTQSKTKKGKSSRAYPKEMGLPKKKKIVEKDEAKVKKLVSKDKNKSPRGADNSKNPPGSKTSTKLNLQFNEYMKSKNLNFNFLGKPAGGTGATTSYYNKLSQKYQMD